MAEQQRPGKRNARSPITKSLDKATQRIRLADPPPTPLGRLGQLARFATQAIPFARAHRTRTAGALLIFALALMLLSGLTGGRIDTSCALREQVGIAEHQRYWPRVRQWCADIMRAAQSSQLDPSLIAALILVESGGNATAYSSSGAVGLMQVMPRDGIAARFNCPRGPCFANRPTISELREPGFNVTYGATLLRHNLDRTGSLREALRSYGPYDVGYRYADLVLATYQAVKP